MSVYSELKRRNVFRVAAAYIVVGWLFLQVADIVLDWVSAPEWVGKAIIALLVLSFIPALAVAWIFEVTPDGVKRDDGTLPDTNGHQAKRLDVITIGAVVVLAVMMFWQQLSPRGEPDGSAATAQKSDQASTTNVIANSNARQVSADAESIVAPENSIAVLPFANRSSQADTQFFVDGVHDDLLTQLARNAALRVISRTSVMEYRDTSKNLRQIGQELGVANLLEGAVQRAGNRVRINAQLIDADTDEHLWAESFDRELTPENIFDIQTDIAGAIARALASTLTGAPSRLATSAPTSNLDAYDLYLRARAIPNDGTLEDVRRAIELARRAVELDPGFALAMGEVGYGYTNAYWYTTGDPKDRAEGRKWLERALELAPDEPRLQFLWADHLYHGYLDYDAALAALEKAEEGLPNGAEIYQHRSWILRRRGDFEGAIAAMNKALQLNPRAIQAIAHHIFTYVFIGDLKGARRWSRRVLGFPDATPVHISFAHMIDYYMLGDTRPMANYLSGRGDLFGPLNYVWLELPFLERRYEMVLERLAGMPGEMITSQFAVWPKSWVRARVFWEQGQRDAARAQAREAIEVLGRALSGRPKDPRLFVARAFMHALLGDEAATRADAAMAQQVYPVERDVPEAPNYIADGIRAIAVFADTTEVAELLRAYLALPAKTYYIDYLMLDPVFDRHRDDAAIQALQKKYTLRKPAS